MDYHEVVKRLAPCGLDCTRCADYESGEIKNLSLRLLELLGNYGRLAKIKAGAEPVFGDYPQFSALLTRFSRSSCSGCRGENVQCPIICKVKTCHKEKGVNFCFQCADYPCNSQYDSLLLRERWRKLNDRMNEVGVVEFYLEQCRLPRY